MKYDDNEYLDNEDNNDLWDDELDISSGESPSKSTYQSSQGYPAHETFDPYDSDYTDTVRSDDRDEDDDESQSDAASQQQNKTDTEDDYYSDPDTKAIAKPKREGFFRKKVNDDDGDNDFFDSDDEPVSAKRPKAPKLDPEDPDYWMEEESPLDDIIHKTRNKWKWWLSSAITLLILIVFSWIWFLRPYVDNGVRYGYLINMERRGSIIKTFEGTMVPYKELGDPNPMYFEKVRFSVESDSLATVMKRMMIRCVPARVEYKMYHSPLPWKGESNLIIIRADSADTRLILPPEFRR